MKKKDRNGDYYLEYILETPPSGADKTIWKEAVKEQLRRMGISDEEFHKVKTVKNMPWRDLRRLYNRLVGQGKQRKDKNSKSGADGPFMHTSYKDAKKVMGRFKKKHEDYNPAHDAKLNENVNEYMKQFDAPGVEVDDGLPVLIPNPVKAVKAAPNHGAPEFSPSLNQDKPVDGRVMDNAFNQDASINRRMGFTQAAAGGPADKLTLRDIELGVDKVDLLK